MVRMKGVEPIRREALDPKSSVSANSTTSAYFGRDYRNRTRIKGFGDLYSTIKLSPYKTSIL